jgi:hypothetical protein
VVRAGSLATAGSLAKEARKAFTGAFTPAGTVGAVKAALLSLTGSLATSGALLKQTRRALTGTVAGAGGLNRTVFRAFTGVLTTAGSLTGSLAGAVIPTALYLVGVVARWASTLTGLVMGPASTLSGLSVNGEIVTMSERRTVLTEEYGEASTVVLEADIEDDAGTGFKPETLTLTLLVKASGAIVNSRNGGSILDTNGGTVSAGGALVLTLAPADQVIVAPLAGKRFETHIARLAWTWASGAKAGWHEIEFNVYEQAG